MFDSLQSLLHRPFVGAVRAKNKSERDEWVAALQAEPESAQVQEKPHQQQESMREKSQDLGARAARQAPQPVTPLPTPEVLSPHSARDPSLSPIALSPEPADIPQKPQVKVQQSASQHGEQPGMSSCVSLASLHVLNQILCINGVPECTDRDRVYRCRAYTCVCFFPQVQAFVPHMVQCVCVFACVFI